MFGSTSWLHPRSCITLSVFVEGSKYHGDIVCRILPSNKDKISWNLESCRLCLVVIHEPRLCPSGRKKVWFCLWTDPGGPLWQWIVEHRRSLHLWGIALCCVYSQTHPWVLNLIGPTSWHKEKSCMQLWLGRYLGDHCPQPEWWIDHFSYSSGFEKWSWALSRILAVHSLKYWS